MSPDGALSVSLCKCEWRETASTDTCTDRRLEPFLTSPASCSCAYVMTVLITEAVNMASWQSRGRFSV